MGGNGNINSRLQESLSRLVLYPNVFAPGRRVSGTKRYASQKKRKTPTSHDWLHDLCAARVNTSACDYMSDVVSLCN